MIDFEEIVKELEYRAGESPNFKKPRHISILSEILDETNLRHVKNELLKILLEKEVTPRTSKEVERDGKKDEKYKGIGGPYYVKSTDWVDAKEGDKSYRPGAPKFVKDGDSYKQIDQAEFEKDKSNEPRKDDPKIGKDGDMKPDEIGKDGEDEAGADKEAELKQQQDNIKKTFADKDYQDQIKNEEDAAKDDDKPNEDGTKEIFTKEDSIENDKKLQQFVTVGYDDSSGAPGNAGSMLNEITSIVSATDYLNDGVDFNYDEAMQKNVVMIKDGKLGEENQGKLPSGRVKTAEARLVAQQYGVSIGLASKIIIATKAAKKKHYRVSETIIKKNGMTDFSTTPLFGDAAGLALQRKMIESTKGEIKLGNTTISSEEALQIINDSGGGNNPSDTAIFVQDKTSGNLHMSFFSDKDATNALVAQSTLSAENNLKKEELNKLVESGGLTKEEVGYYTNQMDTVIDTFKKLEDSLSTVVEAPGKHLKGQNVNDLTNLAKNISKGKDPEKYWKSMVVKKFTSTRNPAYKTITPLLPKAHQDPPTDNEMMEAYIKYVNLPENIGNLAKDDQRIITDLSNQTNGPRIGKQIGEIRKKTISTDLDLIKKLDEKKITIDGRQVGLGTYLEAKSVFEKLHMDMLFGGEGVYKDSDAFCQENGGVTVDRKVMEHCLPYDTKTDAFVNFEIGEEVDQLSRGEKIVTGSTKIVYALTKSGKRYPIGEKKQRTKQGPLSKLNTVYNFHKSLQNCFDKNG